MWMLITTTHDPNPTAMNGICEMTKTVQGISVNRTKAVSNLVTKHRTDKSDAPIITNTLHNLKYCR